MDWMGDNLYWTDDGPKKTISVARLEKAAQTRKTLIEGKMTHPRAIVVDPLNGCVFPGPWGRRSQELWVSELAGETESERGWQPKWSAEAGIRS